MPQDLTHSASLGALPLLHVQSGLASQQAAVDSLTQRLSAARDDFRKRTAPELRRQLDKLRDFLDTRTAQLEVEFMESVDKGLSTTREYRRQQKEREQREIRRKHDDYKTWITETMETEDAPSIRLFAVFGNFDDAS